MKVFGKTHRHDFEDNSPTDFDIKKYEGILSRFLRQFTDRF